MAQDSMDWNGFVAFHGEAQLDRSIMQDTFTLQNVRDWGTDIGKFSDFISKLRKNLGDAGIPAKHQSDVAALLDDFFPDGKPPNRYKLDPLVIGQQERTVAPDTIRWGSLGGPLGIADGPSALAYIFSVVTPTTQRPCLNNYYLPLLAYFSKCLYLAFIGQGAGETTPLLSSVPMMSCIMYMDGIDQPYMLGGTYALSGNSGQNAVASREEQRVLDIYRKNTILTGGLAHISKSPSKLPRFDPRTLRQYAETFLILFRGKFLVQGKATPAVLADDVARVQLAAFEASIRAILVAQNDIRAAAPSLALLDDIERRAEIRRLVENLITMRFTAGFGRTSVNVEKAYKDLLRYYITPCLRFTPPAPAPAVEVAVPPEVQTAINTSVDTLWIGIATVALDKLDYIHTQLNAPILGDIWLPRTPWGRCAETYPVVGLLSNFFDNTETTKIRGIAMAVQTLGQNCELFANDFNAHQLALAGDNGPYRYPCENCVGVMPIFTIDPSKYNTDANGMLPTSPPVLS